MIPIRIDANIVEQARQTDMLDFLEKRHGFTFTHRAACTAAASTPALL
jgi:hypothetical protein